MPDPDVDLVKVAQSVGRSTVENCSACHFNGGGGTGVKHGDMDNSLINPKPETDIHMGGIGFTCSDCHAGENHAILGASHGSIAAGTNHISCEDCHSDKPHERKSLNKHVRSVACETCHIPLIAKEPTKTWWDWSTAGQDREVIKDKYGMPLYDKKKGDFVWEKDIVPEYRWYNGQADYYRMGQKIDPSHIVELNKLSGNIEDHKAKITPFKIMRGKQIYDTGNNYLIVPNLFGPEGYWNTFDWDQASRIGMETAGLGYSGNFGFVETEMYWPVNHMVAPAENSLKCTACQFKGEANLLKWEDLGYKGDPVKNGSRFE
jgi:octaheme c-type cytochrome (tetrathionate reductase family)